MPYRFSFYNDYILKRKYGLVLLVAYCKLIPYDALIRLLTRRSGLDACDRQPEHVAGSGRIGKAQFIPADGGDQLRINPAVVYDPDGHRQDVTSGSGQTGVGR